MLIGSLALMLVTANWFNAVKNVKFVGREMGCLVRHGRVCRKAGTPKIFFVQYSGSSETENDEPPTMRQDNIAMVEK